MKILDILVIVSAVAALLSAYGLSKWICYIDEGDDSMREIAVRIRKGAMAFLREQYKIMIMTIFLICMIMGFTIGWQVAGLFVCGAFLSAISGFVGMNIATKGNVRTANAAKKYGTSKALRISFRTGAVLGLAVVGFGLLGIAVTYMIMGKGTANAVTGFAFGASTMALFARVGGGIYSKAADMGADLTTKFEKRIGEDDLRNPASIADNVGDNIGSVAGMGSDLFESYTSSIIAAIFIAAIMPVTNPLIGESFKIGVGNGAMFPLLIASIGVIASIAGIMSVRGNMGKGSMRVMDLGIYISSVIVSAGALILSKIMFGTFWCGIAVILGILVGIIIGKVTEFYTSEKYRPVKRVVKSADIGVAPSVLSGLSVGMQSTMVPILILAIGTVLADAVAGVYGVALAAVGMMSSEAIIVGIDAYGSVADNACGIAKMANMSDGVKGITDRLDSVGNTAAAVCKEFAIGSAAMTALAFIVAYSQMVNSEMINILAPNVLAGILVGAMLPFLFSSVTIDMVVKGSTKMINQIRAQISSDSGIVAGTSTPDYNECMETAQKTALNGMLIPGILAIAAPLAVGFILGAEALSGMLIGALVTGVIWATTMANAGCAWDNAKKALEVDHYGDKPTGAYKASLISDTVGDPLKDTAGPSLNILVKLMAIVAIVFSGLLI